MTEQFRNSVRLILILIVAVPVSLPKEIFQEVSSLLSYYMHLQKKSRKLLPHLEKVARRNLNCVRLRREWKKRLRATGRG